MAKLPQSCGAGTAVGALGQRGRRGRRHKAPPPAQPPAAPGASARGAEEEEEEEEERPYPARGCAQSCHGAGRGKGQGAHRPEAGGGGGGGEGGCRGLPATPGTSAVPGGGCRGCPRLPGLCSPPRVPTEDEGRWPTGATSRGEDEHPGAGGGEAAGTPQQGHRGHQGEGWERGAGCGRARRGRAGRCVSPQGQERVRRSSVDLRREIIDVGSIQRLIELRKQRRKRREERAATPEPPPPPEPLEIVGEGGSQKAGVPWRSSTWGPLVVPAAPALPCPALRRVPWSRRPSCEPPCRARSASSRSSWRMVAPRTRVMR